jgi:hypothetical protein
MPLAGRARVANWTTTDHTAKSFIGWKASMQAIDRLTAPWNGATLGYDDQYAPEESPCSAFLHRWSMRDRKR